MASITIAFRDEDHPVPGIDCALAAGLFIMLAYLYENFQSAMEAGLPEEGQS